MGGGSWIGGRGVWYGGSWHCGEWEELSCKIQGLKSSMWKGRRGGFALSDGSRKWGFFCSWILRDEVGELEFLWIRVARRVFR